MVAISSDCVKHKTIHMTHSLEFEVRGYPFWNLHDLAIMQAQFSENPREVMILNHVFSYTERRMFSAHSTSRIEVEISFCFHLPFFSM